MLFILNGIDSVRTRSATIGPGGFNAIIQLNHGINEYANALEQYRYNIANPHEHTHWRKLYQAKFNILWGNFNHFNLRSLELGSTDSLQLKISAVLDDLTVLRDQIHELGTEYFHSSINYRDTWVENLSNLYKLLLFFSAVLVTTACLLIAFLFRSNHKKNMLIQEADDARSALSSTVEELRSGRLEQRAKDSFIAAASHDLRQPLHALGLFLGSLDAHIVDDKGRSTLNEAIECSTNLGSLFNSLLDLSRLDAGIVKVELEHFRLQNLVDMLQHEYQAKTFQTPIEIKMQVEDAVVKSDPILLSRIVRTLIENALIHSRADTITVKCVKKNNIFQLMVQDNGVGISLAEQGRVFNEYYQINNRSSGAGKGLGLGLSIVKRLADLLDMRISLQSEVGVSTTFTMDINAGDERKVIEPESAHSVMPTPWRDTGGTIAVIDDDEKICIAMASMLQSMGLNAITATSADELIDIVIESDAMPNMIVADYRLQKGKTGDQAIIQLRRALNMNIPGLLITGDTAPHHVADAARSGFEMLHKPVQPAELSDKIMTTLANHLEEATRIEAKSAVSVAN